MTSEQLAELLGTLNTELTGQSMGAILQVLQQANLSMPRLVALFHLQRSGSATISELSEQLNLALATTSQIIDQMVQSGLVERREDANDRRQKLVTLTSSGHAMIAQVRQVRQSEIAQRLAELPPELTTRLADLLVELVAALRRETMPPAAQPPRGGVAGAALHKKIQPNSSSAGEKCGQLPSQELPNSGMRRMPHGYQTENSP
jgi:DNA-binding MarR family transcriptional regulator